MTDTPQRYPLTWPVGVPRKRARKTASFGTMKRVGGRSYDSKESLTVAEAFNRLENEIERLGAANAILSSNIELTVSGRPYSGRREPDDPGAALYFTLRGKPIALPCDTYDRVADNIAALAKHIEATRAISRLGVSTIEQAFSAFDALPPPVSAGSRRPWREVLPGVTDLDTLNARYRSMAKQRAGNEAALLELNLARDDAKEELGDG